MYGQDQQGRCILFSVVFTPPHPSHHGSVNLSPTCHLSAQGAEPPPLPLPVATAGKNQLNEKITPFLPIGMYPSGERYCQAIKNFGHASLVSRCVTVCISQRKSLIS